MKGKRQRVKCPACGFKYKSRELRCPMCSEARPMTLGEGLTGTDRVVGVALIVLGAVLIVPAFWLVYFALRYGGFRIKATALTIVWIPIGALFNGILLVNGIHPRAFYSWWENLSDITRYLIWGGLAIIGAMVFIVFIFGGAAPEPTEFEPEVN